MSKLIVGEIESTGTSVQINDDLKVGSTGTNVITSANVVAPSEDMIKNFKAFENPITIYDAAVSSTGVPGEKNAVPHETSTSTGLTSTTALSVPSTGGNALLTNLNANSVYLYASSGTANCRNDYWGVTIDIPAAFRGENIVLNFDYRTEAAGTNDTAADQWFVAVQDKSNTVQTTQSSTLTSGTTIAAGSNILMTSKSGLSVGDKIWFETGGTSSTTGNVNNSITEAYITEISSTDNNIKVSQDVQVITSGQAVTKFLTNTLQLLPAADSDTNKVGKNHKLAFKTEENTSQVNVFFQLRNTSSTVVHSLYFDNVYLSSNKFLQASSQLKTEAYGSVMSTAFWGSSTALSRQWDKALLVPKIGSPPIDDSKFITISDITGPGTHGTVTAITAKQPIELAVTVVGQLGSTNYLNIYDQDGNSVGEYQNASGTMWGQVTSNLGLAKDDYIFFYKETSTNANGNIQIVAKAQTSDVILLESQDQIFTDWQSYTDVFDTTSWAAGGANILEKAVWRRVGSEMEIKVDFQVYGSGTVSPNYGIIKLPSGYIIDKTKIGGGQKTILGTYYKTYSSSDFNTTSMSGVVTTRDDYEQYLYLSYQSASTHVIELNSINAFANHNERFMVNAKVPIQGWNSNFNPLLSMPLVDLGGAGETWHTGWDSTNALWTSTSGTGNHEWNASTLLRNAAGTAGTISTSDYITIATGTNSNGSSTGSLATTRIQAKQDIFLSGGITGNLNAGAEIIVFNDLDQEIIREQQDGSTYTTPVYINNWYLPAGRYIYFDAISLSQNYGSAFLTAKPARSGNMAHIIKPAVAILKDVKAYNVDGGGSTTGAFNSRDLNTIEGESWFVTLSDPNFTLEPGMYKIEARVPFVGTNYSSARLYDVTNSAVVKYSNTSWTEPGGSLCIIDTVKTVTASTQFRIQYRVSAASAGNGLGVQQNTDSTAVSVYTQVVIEKLK